MSDRIYRDDDGQWYFSVRGDVPAGPYASYDLARDGLNQHIRRCRRFVQPDTTGWPRWLSPGRLFRKSQPRHP